MPESEEYKVGDQSPPRIHQFGGEEANPQGKGPEKGARYLKSALKRHVQKNPRDVDLVAAQLFNDATGRTRVEQAVHVGKGETSTEQVPISVADRQRAAGMLADRLDGKPVQEIDVAGAPTTMVIVAHSTGGMDPGLSEEIAAIVESHEDEATDAVDLSNPHPDPETEEEPDEPDE